MTMFILLVITTEPLQEFTWFRSHQVMNTNKEQRQVAADLWIKPTGLICKHTYSVCC